MPHHREGARVMGCRTAGPFSSRTGLLSGVAGLLLAACAGTIDDTPPGSTEGPPTVVGAPRPQPPGPSVPPPPPEVAQGACQPTLPARIWRLTPQQYANALVDLFGFSGVAPAQLPLDAGDAATGFLNDARSLFVTPNHVTSYFDTAKAAATALVPTALKDVPCLAQAQPDAACARDFVQRYGRKAFRRTLTTDEGKRYEGFFTQNVQAFGAQDAARMVLQAMLQAPGFLYRSEVGVLSGRERVLSREERASLLAFTLTDAPPSPALLAAAEQGRLDTEAGARQEALALMRGPRAAAVFQQFIGAHLHHKKALDNAAVDAALAADMLVEAEQFVSRVVWGQAGDGTLRDLFLKPVAVVNARLATHYGLKASGTGFTTVETDPRKRFGLLTQGAFLAGEHGPILRGRAMKVALLCQEPPDPPPQVVAQAAQLYPSDKTATEAELYRRFQTESPGCAACHTTFQPLGLALERYDEIGRYRDTTAAGKPIETAFKMVGADGWSGEFTDARDLVEKIVASDAGQACFVRKYLTYALGKALETPGETCLATTVAQGWAAADLSLAHLVAGTVAHAATARRVIEEVRP